MAGYFWEIGLARTIETDEIDVIGGMRAVAELFGVLEKLGPALH